MAVFAIDLNGEASGMVDGDTLRFIYHKAISSSLN